MPQLKPHKNIAKSARDKQKNQAARRLLNSENFPKPEIRKTIGQNYFTDTVLWNDLTFKAHYEAWKYSFKAGEFYMVYRSYVASSLLVGTIFFVLNNEMLSSPQLWQISKSTEEGYINITSNIYPMGSYRLTAKFFLNPEHYFIKLSSEDLKEIARGDEENTKLKLIEEARARSTNLNYSWQ